jgi:hypothetical protein
LKGQSQTDKSGFRRERSHPRKKVEAKIEAENTEMKRKIDPKIIKTMKKTIRQKVAWATLATLITLSTQIGAKASEEPGSQVNYVKIEVCGDAVGRDPRTGCIKLERYLWGTVGEAKLIRSQTIRTGGEYETYNVVIPSRGCFPTYTEAKEEGTYDLNTRISVGRGKTTIKTSAHPIAAEIVEEVRKTRNTPGLMGGRSCLMLSDS